MSDEANTEVVATVEDMETANVVSDVTDILVVEEESVLEQDIDGDGIEDQTPEQLGRYIGDFVSGVTDMFNDISDAVNENLDKLKAEKEKPEGQGLNKVFDKDV